MRALLLFSIALFLIMVASCREDNPGIDDQFSLAQRVKKDLQLSVYITAHAIEGLSTTDGRREALSLLRAHGITKVYIEVYRSGFTVEPTLLKEVNIFFKGNGFETVGGIATVPGGNFGKAQEAKLGWFNWQNQKTQNDLLQVMQETTPLFDTFIIDDFLCTADTSAESTLAKGPKEWGEYRRDLLVKLSSSLFIAPAKKINPSITMIIKYPQWYDRYHLFGYDVARQPALFDQVWIGTETRGQYTQRFGFVQPYEGFINYRWMNSLSGNKMGGAWFDHGDCDEMDFIEQAYQSVLAGAKEIVIFNYTDLVSGHKGHHLLRMDFEKLALLAQAVAKNPVFGIPGYKPPNSDAGGDLYIMDYIGMLGVPLLPVSSYPENEKTVFLPTQAAKDTAIYSKILQSLKNGASIIFTSGFLAQAPSGNKLAELAGLDWPLEVSPHFASQVKVDGKPDSIKYGLGLECPLSVKDANVLLEAVQGQHNFPFLTQSPNGKIFVLNTHTFSQKDFDAVGETLLCPRPLGLLEIPLSWANTLRKVFNAPLNLDLVAPSRVSFQPLTDQSYVIHNYNSHETPITLKVAKGKTCVDAFTGKNIPWEYGGYQMTLPGRSRIWMKIK